MEEQNRNKTNNIRFIMEDGSEKLLYDLMKEYNVAWPTVYKMCLDGKIKYKSCSVDIAAELEKHNEQNRIAYRKRKQIESEARSKGYKKIGHYKRKPVYGKVIPFENECGSGQITLYYNHPMNDDRNK